jgi:hypothetical protein
MPARVLHIGQDDCHRLMVLESAGYSVEDCEDLAQLRGQLADGAPAAALLVSEDGRVLLQDIVAVARAHASVPVILFANSNRSHDDPGVDVVVDCLTPPEVWLNDVEGLIEKTRATLRA